MNNDEIKIWESFLEHIEKIPTTSPIPKMLLSHLQKHLINGRLSISLKESCISFNKKNLDLSKRKKIRKVFEVFLHQQDSNPVDRNSLIKHIYNENIDHSSERQQLCHHHNVIKLISRARHLASKTFQENEEAVPLHWFPYDPCSQTWRLYSIKDDHVF
jgi:hypothetical protein